MRILILGGSVFLGSATLAAALAAGHTLTVFNRGRSRSAWPEGVETLRGDRSGDLGALFGALPGSVKSRHWDAVIDCCGYVPADVQASAEALADRCGRYLFVSSISAYATMNQIPVTESDPLASADGIARDDRSARFYGAQKAACEFEVVRVFGERATVVRPGLIVGPGDLTGRFSYWPWRSAEGGAMLVPDVPNDDPPLQFIDVRDLAAWLVRLLEADRGGTYNATGPVPSASPDPAEPLLRWSTLLAACAAEVARRGGTPARPVRVHEDFLLAQGVKPWSELPLWLPSSDAETAGFFHVGTQRAAAAGLTTRRLSDTIVAVLDEGAPPEGDPRRAGRLLRSTEETLLATWAARH